MSDIKKIKETINKSGFKILSFNQDIPISYLSIRFYISLLFTLPLLAHMLVEQDSVLNNKYLQLGSEPFQILSNYFLFLKEKMWDVGKIKICVGKKIVRYV